MMKWLLILFPLLLVGLGASPEKKGTDPFKFACQQVAEQYPDAKTCKQAKLRPPITVATELVPYPLYGVYIPGEPYIFIRPSTTEVPFLSVVVHETTHYILYELGIVKANDPASKCLSESVAREVTSAYDGKPVNPNWRAVYGCPK